MLRLSATLMGVFLLLPQAAQAMQVGKMTVTPSAGLEERYDTNIYLVPPDEKGVSQGGGVVQSMINDIKFGLGVKFPISDIHSVSLDYKGNALFYNRYPSQNNAFHQGVDLDYNYKAGALWANLYNRYLNTTDPAFSEQIDRSLRWENKAGLILGYKPEGGKLFVEISGDTKRDKYIDGNLTAAGTPGLGQLLDRVQLHFGLKTGYYVQPKTRVFVSYDRDIIHYTNDPTPAGAKKDNKAHAVGFGLEGKLSEKLQLTAQTGWSTRKYDETTLADAGPLTAQTSNTVNWFMGLNAKHQCSERTSVVLNYARRIDESSYSTNRFSIGNQTNLDVSHGLTGQLKLKLGVGWGLNKYPDATTTGGLIASRRDDTYSGKLGLDYKINENLNAYVKYQYDQRFSTFSGQFNYKRHMPSLGVSAKF